LTHGLHFRAKAFEEQSSNHLKLWPINFSQYFGMIPARMETGLVLWHSDCRDMGTMQNNKELFRDQETDLCRIGT
jgi:hypothetical protein